MVFFCNRTCSMYVATQKHNEKSVDCFITRSINFKMVLRIKRGRKNGNKSFKSTRILTCERF